MSLVLLLLLSFTIGALFARFLFYPTDIIEFLSLSIFLGELLVSIYALVFALLLKVILNIFVLVLMLPLSLVCLVVYDYKFGSRFIFGWMKSPWRQITVKKILRYLRKEKIELVYLLVILSVVAAYTYISLNYRIMFRSGGDVFQHMALLKLMEEILGLRNYYLVSETYPMGYTYDPRLGPNFVFVAVVVSLSRIDNEAGLIIMGILNIILLYTSIYMFVKELRNKEIAIIVGIILLF